MKFFSFSFYFMSVILITPFTSCTLDNASLLEQIKKNEVLFIDCMFTDLNGTLRGLTIPASQMNSALKSGLSFDGSSIPGYTDIHESDLLLLPDKETFRIVQTNGYASAQIICDVYKDHAIAYESDPRTILKSVLNEAHELGYEFFVGPELEFFLFSVDQQNKIIPCDTAKYFQLEGSLLRDFQKKSLLNGLLNVGINVEKLHHEVAPGQHEMSIHYDNAVAIADQIMLAKHYISAFAQEHGLRATFMPKPILNQNGSGMHIHFSLFDKKNNRNAFYTSNDAFLLSDIAYHFIAGILQFAPDLSALFNATINSYKRLVPGHEAPIYRCWATKNRSAMIRIPQIDPTQSAAARAELRSPDALCNPYLAFAGLLKAGLEGIKQKLQLAKATDVNLYHLSPSELLKRGISTLPTTLEESLNFFSRSQFIHNFLSEHTITEYLKLKQEDVQLYKKMISTWEIEHYL